jgi:hypothetical protein
MLAKKMGLSFMNTRIITLGYGTYYKNIYKNLPKRINNLLTKEIEKKSIEYSDTLILESKYEKNWLDKYLHTKLDNENILFMNKIEGNFLIS